MSVLREAEIIIYLSILIAYWGGTVRKLLFFGSLAFAALLISYPAEAFEAAFQAMCTWATGFAPSLFPFFLLLPALTCDEALAFYEKAFARVLPGLFGLPGRAASAVSIALLAGSPAGSIAAARVIAAGGVSLAEGKRLQVFASGLSPMFLLSAVGIGLFHDSALGAVLMRSQMLAYVASALIFKHLFRADEAAMIPATAQEKARAGGIAQSVQQLAGVCGYMVLFATIARLLTALISRPGLAAPLLGVLEVAGGLNALNALPISVPSRAVLFTALSCFGGVCVGVQNRAKLSNVALSPLEFLLAKLLHALLGALFTLMQLNFFSGAPGAAVDPLAPLFVAAFAGLAASACVFFDLYKQRRQVALEKLTHAREGR